MVQLKDNLTVADMSHREHQGPLVSIIVPAYNVESYIGRAIASVLNQTYQNIELLIVDDGSTDATSEVCKSTLPSNANCLVIEQSNKGVSSARNNGLNHAHGDYIFFLDADDYLDYSAIEQLVNRSIATNSDVVLVRARFISSTNEWDQILPNNLPKDCSGVLNPLTIGYPAYTWNYFFSSSVIGNHRFNSSLRFGEDCEFISRVLVDDLKYSFEEKPVYFYTVGRAGSALSANEIDVCRGLKHAKGLVYQRVAKHDCHHIAAKEFLEASFGVLRRVASNRNIYYLEAEMPNQYIDSLSEVSGFKAKLTIFAAKHPVIARVIFILLSLYPHKLRIQ